MDQDQNAATSPNAPSDPFQEAFQEALAIVTGTSRKMAHLDHLKALLVRLQHSENQRNLLTCSYLATLLEHGYRENQLIVTPASQVFDIAVTLQLGVAVAKKANGDITAKIDAPHGTRLPRSANGRTN
jgi:hypothetical protein